MKNYVQYIPNEIHSGLSIDKFNETSSFAIASIECKLFIVLKLRLKMSDLGILKIKN